MSMNVVIIEDEPHAASMLTSHLLKANPNVNVITVLDSVKASLNWLQGNQDPVDLFFVDIELADGNSFEIFKHTSLPAPVIFTTAYDQYAIDAFKMQAIHYLLKPINSEDIKEALDRIPSERNNDGQNAADIKDIALKFRRKKNRCLVKKGSSYQFINVPDIALAYSDEGVTFLITFDGHRHIYNSPIEQLADEFDSERFFQVNRGQLVNADNVIAVHSYLGQRLKLQLRTMGPIDMVLVSRNRATDFKSWLDK